MMFCGRSWRELRRMPPDRELLEGRSDIAERQMFE